MIIEHMVGKDKYDIKGLHEGCESINTGNIVEGHRQVIPGVDDAVPECMMGSSTE